MTDKECEIETSKAIMEMRNLIAELEKEKCELLGIIQGKDKVIQELEKENAELTKAKEIIKDYMIIAKGAHTTVCSVPEENRTIHVLKLNEKAEQFLKDSDIDETIWQTNEGLDFDKIADEVKLTAKQ